MAHSIFGKRFLSVREPAWHGIGLSYTGPKTAIEAVTESGAHDIDIRTRIMGWMLDDGTFEAIDDQRVIVRMPTKDDPRTLRLGDASSRYTVLQNTQIARALDDCGITKRYPVETCGVLHDGATLFICLDMGTVEIVGEAHRKYATITDCRDGRSKLTWLTSATRVVCANTLQVAMAEGDVKLAIEHTQHIEGDFQFALDVIDRVEEQSEKTVQALTALHEIRVTSEDLDGVLDATYPQRAKGSLLRQYERVDDPTKFDPATLARLQQMQERYEYTNGMNDVLKTACRERYAVLCDEYPVHAGNALGVFNTVAEISDHTRNGRASGSSIVGTRADEKLRAYNALVALA